MRFFVRISNWNLSWNTKNRKFFVYVQISHMIWIASQSCLTSEATKMTNYKFSAMLWTYFKNSSLKRYSLITLGSLYPHQNRCILASSYHCYANWIVLAIRFLTPPSINAKASPSPVLTDQPLRIQTVAQKNGLEWKRFSKKFLTPMTVFNRSWC